MIKAILSYSKKVPASEQYSSQGYHLSMEQELPDNLRQDELKAQIHATYDLVKQIVDEELSGKTKPVVTQAADQADGDVQASNAQIKFLTDLARQADIAFDDLNQQVQDMYHVGVYQLKKRDCSRLINDLKRTRRRAA